MKSYSKTHLPDSITYNGEVYTFNGAISGAMAASGTNPADVIKSLKSTGKKGILVKVLSRRLRGMTDLHGKLYTPSEFIFTN